MVTHNAGYIRRFAAQVIDSIFYLLVVFIPLVLIMFFARNSLSAYVTLNLGLYLVFVIFLGSFFNLLYQVYFLTRYGGTIGKLVLNIRVLDRDDDRLMDPKTAFYRSTAGYGFSSQFFGLGFLKMIKDPDNRGWHDDLFNTHVILINQSKKGVLVLLAMFCLLVALLLILGDFISTSSYLELINLSNLPKGI